MYFLYLRCTDEQFLPIVLLLGDVLHCLAVSDLAQVVHGPVRPLHQRGFVLVSVDAVGDYGGGVGVVVGNGEATTKDLFSPIYVRP